MIARHVRRIPPRVINKGLSTWLLAWFAQIIGRRKQLLEQGNRGRYSCTAAPTRSANEQRELTMQKQAARRGRLRGSAASPGYGWVKSLSNPLDRPCTVYNVIWIPDSALSSFSGHCTVSPSLTCLGPAVPVGLVVLSSIA